MRLLAVCVLIILTLTRFDTSLAKPVEMQSKNFILSGDIKRKDGAALLNDLELFRNNVFKVLDVTAAHEIVPVQVYVAKNEKALKSVIGVGGFSGVYTMTHSGPAIVLNGKAGFRKGGQDRHIALHEYTHHIVGAYTKLDYPLWHKEGFANYLATFSYKDGTFQLGQPHEPYLYSLRQNDWMPMTVVLGTMEKYPFNIGDTSKIGQQTQAQFYAQTWLAVHYLRSEEKYKAKLQEYVQRLNKGEGNLQAFKAAMGVTPEEFEVELKAYLEKNKFNVTRFATTQGDIAAPSLKDLTPQEAEMAKLSAMRSFVFTPDRRDIVIKAYEDYEAEYGESARTLVAKADLTAYNANTKEAYENARGLIEKALALDTDNIEANNIAAMILIHQNGQGLGGNVEDMTQARKYAAKALQQDPQSPLANYSYALSFNGRHDPPENALKAASHALDYYRDIGFMGSNLGLAAILLNGDKFEEALPTVRRAITWSKDPGMRMAAQNMRKYIETEKGR